MDSHGATEARSVSVGLRVSVTPCETLYHAKVAKGSDAKIAKTLDAKVAKAESALRSSRFSLAFFAS